MSTSHSISWHRVFRLIRAPQLWGSWRAKVLAIFAWLLIAMPSFAALTARHASSGGPPMAGIQFIVMLIYFFYAFTSVLNGGWRRLPVTDAERRAAVWVNIWLLPLLCCLSASLASAGLAWIFEPPIDLRTAVALFAVQALIIGLFAVTVFLVGSWPQRLSWFQMMSRRRIGDWFVWLLFSAIILFSIAWRPERAWLIHFAWKLAAAALFLGAATFPVAQHWARVDAQQEDDDGSGRSLLPQLSLGGWSGHIAVQVSRAMFMTVALAVAFSAMLLIQHGAGADPLTKAFAGGEAAAFAPPLMAAFVSTIGGQALLRSRRTLLTLPRGGLLVLVTPAVQFLAVLAVMYVFSWAFCGKAPGAWPLASLASFGALAFAYLAFTINLRANEYWELFAGGLLLALPIGAIGVIAGLGAKAGKVVHVPYLGLAAVISVVLASSLAWAIWSLRGSRRPYRPWPINTARWHAS